MSIWEERTGGGLKLPMEAGGDPESIPLLLTLGQVPCAVLSHTPYNLLAGAAVCLQKITKWGGVEGGALTALRKGSCYCGSGDAVGRRCWLHA